MGDSDLASVRGVRGAELVAIEDGSHLCQLGSDAAAANERMVAFLRT